MRKSRRIAAFLMLSSSKPEDVSQNSLEKDGDLDRTAGDIRHDFNGYTDEYAHVYLDTHIDIDIDINIDIDIDILGYRWMTNIVGPSGIF